ncbi:Ppx/GppA family phosphatase [Hyphococcus flavus]|uniref:Ppx/GppA family phosphatase n=1 Tax=Hyphococcus flavus TaxID=1866326 RepID=A0AAF0CBH2_9PROT|nr:Ppx/GppA family phosphatase [Hyphococcus flavus]WDI30955.1 Ppx/GppA family phosphatase [Hyphococcus flavus]
MRRLEFEYATVTIDGRRMGSGDKLNDTSEGGLASARRAVVDIGSNSVRLVVYDGPPRAPIPICNEKALCGLGREMTKDGGLNPAAVEDALATLSRFRHVLDDLGRPHVEVIATAAVRDARDGKQFVEATKALGFDVNIISGEEEGRLAAYGVAAVEPEATGLVGDMGGGSLELALLNKGEIEQSNSLPVGPFNLMRAAGGDNKAAVKFIEEQLDSIKFLKPKKIDTIYSVGGAWRAVARIHMGLRSYPLSVLHHYEMSSQQVLDICDLIARQSRRSLEEVPGIPRRRIDTLPLASMVLRAVVTRVKADKIIVSAGGVREGLLYNQLSKEQRASDPFIEACKYYAQRLSPDPAFGEAAYKVIEPLFANGDASGARLRYGACLLADIGAYFHPDLRGRHAFDTALRAPFVGVSHAERLWTALALFRRHQGRSPAPPDEQAMALMPWDAQLQSTQFGLALRFVAALAPKAPAALKGCKLEKREDEIVFTAPSDREALMGETPRRRFVSLAAAFECAAAEVYED